MDRPTGAAPNPAEEPRPSAPNYREDAEEQTVRTR